MSRQAGIRRWVASVAGQAFLLVVTSASALAVVFIFLFIVRDALPFFRDNGFREFFTSTRWYPSGDPAEFGVLAILSGSAIVTLGAIVFAVPVGIAAAVCMSDVLPFTARQFVKPIIEVLASIPSVAYGFFALVVFAPLMQEQGGRLLAWAAWAVGVPLGALAALLVTETVLKAVPEARRGGLRIVLSVALGALCLGGVYWVASALGGLAIASGTNALNVSIILAVMVLPTVVSVSEDALQTVGRDLREASYACGATRAETMVKVVLPAASSGICSAVILGLMRAVGETMVVWMASGNAAQIPKPWFNLLEPVRTLTATIAGDMGEADHVTGSSRYHVLFAMALCLLLISFACNLASEWVMRRERRKLKGA
ncbi:MAG: phosphate ABC transporter permease subunit PstC [Candidatus Hydrogenedentes bacterium]|nr:phosphate ABC transporter permease subunit PstC [Candidatus Hydrogenedentota bacterium]